MLVPFCPTEHGLPASWYGDLRALELRATHIEILLQDLQHFEGLPHPTAEDFRLAIRHAVLAQSDARIWEQLHDKAEVSHTVIQLWCRGRASPHPAMRRMITELLIQWLESEKQEVENRISAMEEDARERIRTTNNSLQHHEESSHD